MEQKNRYRRAIFAVIVLVLVLFCLLSACSKISAKYWCDRGIALRDNGKYSEAISAFTRAIEADSAYGPAYENRGIAHTNMGHYQLALDDFNKVLSLKDKRVPAQKIYSEIGVAYFRLGNIQDAISEWEKGLAIADDAGLHNNLSVAYLRLNQVDKAAEAASAAYKADPTLPQVLTSMGQIAMMRKDYRQAIEFFERAVEREPSPSRYWNAAVAYQKSKQYDKALQYARRYVEKEKDPGQLQRGYKLIERLRESGGK